MFPANDNMQPLEMMMLLADLTKNFLDALKREGADDIAISPWFNDALRRAIQSLNQVPQ